MNAKIVFTIAVAFCAMQQPASAGVDIGSIIDSVLGSVASSLQNILNEFGSATANVVSDIKSGLKQAEEDIENEIKNEFNNLNTDNAEIKACFQQLGDAFKKIEGEAESAGNNFVLKEGINFLPLVGKINSTINEIKSDSQADLAAGTACGKLGFLQSAACYANLVVTINDQAKAVKAEVDVEVPLAETDLKKLVSDVETTVPKLIKQYTEEAEEAGQDTVACIKTALSNDAAAANATATSS